MGYTANRRQFIKTAVAGSVITLSVPRLLFPHRKDRIINVALAGLGYYSGDLLAPALQLTRHCKLNGIITGSPEKIPEWQKQYGIPDGNIYNYDNLHTIADNPSIDVVYIVVPPALHAKYSIIAANAGKHVWCEKPMAMTAEECQQIIDACSRNKVKLSIGYRMQHEPNTQQIMKFAKELPYGPINNVTAKDGYREGRTDHWKLNWAMGGGAMYDMGVYPLNAARYATGEEPVRVSARHEWSRPEMFKNADEITYFDLDFPSGAVAKCKTSLAETLNMLHVEARDGWYELSPFQSYTGIAGRTSDGQLLNQIIPNQQAKQMDDDALAIINDTSVLVPGEEGQRDIRIVEAIFRSAKSDQPVSL